MKSLRCLFGSHDFYAVYYPLILSQKGTVRIKDFKIMDLKNYQYITIKRICIRGNCKKKEEYIVQLSEKLQDWDVVLSVPNFLSEELKKSEP